MGEGQVIRSVCRGCHGGCGVLVRVERGRVTEVNGDPQGPINQGRICIKGKMAPFLAHHPDRLTAPLRRTAQGWKEIRWDEALGEISERFLGIRERWGAEALALGYGTGRDNEAFIYRFANLFGTPNVLTAGHMCYGPRIATGIALCGNLPVVDYGRPHNTRVPIERCPTGAIVWIDERDGVVRGAASRKIVRHSALPEAPT